MDKTNWLSYACPPEDIGYDLIVNIDTRGHVDHLHIYWMWLDILFGNTPSSIHYNTWLCWTSIINTPRNKYYETNCSNWYKLWYRILVPYTLPILSFKHCCCEKYYFYYVDKLFWKLDIIRILSGRNSNYTFKGYESCQLAFNFCYHYYMFNVYCTLLCEKILI